ncbi:MAG: hypothetical protein ACNA7V_12575 [Bacteroidales bacterium]
MKMWFLSFLVTFIICAFFARAQYVVNQGADIRVSAGTFLNIDGNFRNQNAGSMNNAGNVIVKGNWENNATSGNLLQGSAGTVFFNGTVTQNIGGTAKTWFSNLTLNNSVNMGSEISVSSALSMNNNFMTLNAHNLIMETGSALSGASSSGYIVASGSGKLFRRVTGSSVAFPVGTASAYVPVNLVNTGTADHYGVSVFPDVRTNGLTGGTIPQINDCVNMTWNITEQVPGGSNLTITAFWPGAIEGASFDRTKAGMGHYTGDSWDPQEETPASGSNPYSISRSGIITLSAFAVGDLESPMAIPVDIRLDVYALLEGPYAGTNMMTTLNSGGLIPLSQPYNTSPWNYPGSESVALIPPNVVDWVLVEIRDAATPAGATPATMFGRRAAFLLSNGQIVDLDGSSLPVFSGTVNNYLYVVVWHRNHLNIMSASALTKVGSIYPYDFTNSQNKAYLNGQKNLGGGSFGMYAGNGQPDNTINSNDKNNVWAIQAGTNGYLMGDFNMDGAVGNQDKNDKWYWNLGSASTVP